LAYGYRVLYGKKIVSSNLPTFSNGWRKYPNGPFQEATWNAITLIIRSGYANIAGAIGLSAANRYLSGIDRAGAAAMNNDLINLLRKS